MFHILYIPVWEFYKFLILTNTGYSGNKKAGSKLPAENIYISLLDIASLAFPLREEKDCMAFDGQSELLPSREKRPNDGNDEQ